MLLFKYKRFFKRKSIIAVYKCELCNLEFSINFCKNYNRKYCSRDCSNKAPCSDQKRKKLSEINSGENNKFYGKKHSKEIKNKISLKIKLGFEKMDPEKKRLMLEHLRDANLGKNNKFYGKKHTIECRKRMSETKAKAISEGKFSTNAHRGMRGLYTSLKTNIEERYDSFYELLYMRILDEDKNVVTWTKKHGIKIPYELNGKRLYVPDFFVKKMTGNYIEEIKGYEDKIKLQLKLDALQNYCIQNDFEYSYIDYESLSKLSFDKYNMSIRQLRYFEKQKYNLHKK